jgi:lipopolysaccharide/colanic/teichoic acid biosynthesis glycosyltransferase
MSMLADSTVEQGTIPIPADLTGDAEWSIGTRTPTAPAGRGYLWVKTGIEWVVALILLVLAAPVMVALAILVKLTSDGPIGYSQYRLGRFGKPFQLYKFRTMSHRCEAGTGPVWAVANDPRVTRVGRWLRDTHLDEIPQLWNVLRGQMSLIGPRPERPEIAAQIEQTLPAFRDRLLVRPGITGLAQMRLPADSDLDTVRRKLSHDLYYIRHLSAGLDARLALSTPLRLLGDVALSLSRWLVKPPAPPVLITAPAAQQDRPPLDRAWVRPGRRAVAAEARLTEVRPAA